MDDFAPNHNGGQLQFGPDGDLYIGTGDGGGEERPATAPPRTRQPARQAAAHRALPCKAGYRCRPTTRSSAAGARPEIYAYGLRNPWRFSFDRQTGALSIGDVGQDAFEEVDYLPEGKAPRRQLRLVGVRGRRALQPGPERARTQVRPVLTYSHDRGLLGDRRLRRPRPARCPPSTAATSTATTARASCAASFPPPRAARDDRSLGLSVPALSSFGEDAGGHVYVTSLDGQVFRLVPN